MSSYKQIQVRPQLYRPAHDGRHFATLISGLENLSDYLNEDLLPQLNAAGFTDDAEQLQQQLMQFYEQCNLPYASTPDRGAQRAACDHAAKSLAAICGRLYDLVHTKCNFAEHHAMMHGILNAMHEFDRKAPAALKSMGLEYYEFDSLILELEARLGINASPTNNNGSAQKKERHRSLPKDPQKIESALTACMDAAEKIRPYITNEGKQHKLDRILGDARAILSGLPQDDEADNRGKRISGLLSASAKILEVGKWIRKVKLLEHEPSESVKRAILRPFAELRCLSRGQEPESRRSYW